MTATEIGAAAGSRSRCPARVGAADADGGVESPPEGEGVAVPARGGGETRTGPAAGRNATSATSNAIPTTMPASRPPMITERGPIAGSAAYQYDPAGGARPLPV